MPYLNGQALGHDHGGVRVNVSENDRGRVMLTCSKFNNLKPYL